MANVDFTKKKLQGGNFCENRFCPMCSWRQAKKDALKISICMKHIELEHDKTFIFLTLTAPNVSAENLVDEINRYNYAFKKLMLKKEIKPVNKGYIRKLEITYNDKNNIYHPHFHVVIAVNHSYFKSRDYIKQEKWLYLWQEVMDDYTINQVDVRKMKKNEAKKEVSEIAKYAAKDSDMMINQNVFDNFYNALKGRQILTYNGLFKDANKLYKQGILDKYKEVDETEYIHYLLYRWGKGQYVETECRELTEDERKKVNRQLLDEGEVE